MTINVLVKTLVDAAPAVDVPCRLASMDREDSPPFVVYQVASGRHDQALDGATGLIFADYFVSFCSEDGEQSEVLAEAFANYVDSLAVNAAYAPYVLQSATTTDVSDEFQPEIATDKNLYVYTLQLSLVLGRSS